MEYFKKVQSAFVYSNAEAFDDDFRQLLQIFYFFGFYKPARSTKRVIYGLLVFLLVPLNYLLGTVEDVFVAMNEANLMRVLINIPVISLMTSFVIQNLTFMMRQAKVVQLVKQLQSMHKSEDDGLFEVYRRKCTRLVNLYTIYLTVSITFVICASLCGYRMYKLCIPAFYDSYAEGYLFYPLFFINALHLYSNMTLAITSDLLHILCIVRAGVNFEVLSHKMRQCTESENGGDCEKKLIDCVKHHCRLIEETKKIQMLFNEYFMSKAYGTILIMTCLLYVLMKTDIREDFLTFLLGLIAVGIGLFQFGTLCFFGQWLTSKYADLFDASYDCKWFDQSKSFKKSLIVFRIFCQKEMKLGAVKIDFSHESFYQMMSNSYNYYNSMSQTIESIGEHA